MNTINNISLKVWQKKVWNTILLSLLVSCLWWQDNPKKLKNDNEWWHQKNEIINIIQNTELLDNKDTYSLESESHKERSVNIVNPHITTITKNWITTITIDSLYTKQLGISWSYVCHLIQDKDDENYYIFDSNIDDLIINNDQLYQYLSNTDWFEHTADYIKTENPDNSKHVVEWFLAMHIKDNDYNPCTQSLFNYLNTDNILNACGDNIENEKVVISDIDKKYSRLSQRDMYDLLSQKIEREDLWYIQTRIIEKKINKLAPYIMIEENY